MMWRFKFLCSVILGLTRNPGEVLDVLARFGSLRLPSVAPLEFTLHLIWGGNDALGNECKEVLDSLVGDNQHA